MLGKHFLKIFFAHFGSKNRKLKRKLTKQKHGYNHLTVTIWLFETSGVIKGTP